MGMLHQSNGGAPAGFVVRVSHFDWMSWVASSDFGPLVFRGRVAWLGVRTASKSKYRRFLQTTIMVVVAGRNLSPNAPTGGLGRTQEMTFRARHRGVCRPVSGLNPSATIRLYIVGSRTYFRECTGIAGSTKGPELEDDAEELLEDELLLELDPAAETQ